jgi:hypothetical protein
MNKLFALTVLFSASIALTQVSFRLVSPKQLRPFSTRLPMKVALDKLPI